MAVPKDKGMEYHQFLTFYRGDPAGFWRFLKKTCSCHLDDVRYEKGWVECGKCGRRLVRNK